MKFVITKEQLEALLRYLVGRPYAEVSEGIDLLKKLPLLEEKEQPEPVNEEGAK